MTVIKTAFKGIDINFKISDVHYKEIKMLCVEMVEKFLDGNLQSASCNNIFR